MDKQDVLRGVGQQPVDTAEEAAGRRRRRLMKRRDEDEEEEEDEWEEPHPSQDGYDRKAWPQVAVPECAWVCVFVCVCSRVCVWDHLPAEMRSCSSGGRTLFHFYRVPLKQRPDWSAEEA